jgi:hypothetical protein
MDTAGVTNNFGVRQIFGAGFVAERAISHEFF